MTAVQVVEATILRDTLAGLSSIQALVAINGQYKIFWKDVKDDIPLPYIVTSHYAGGKEPFKPYSDSMWKVVGTTASMSVAVSLANAISELADLWPDVTAFPDMCPIAPLVEVTPIFDRYQVQNVPLLRVGGIYRIRLQLDL